MREAVENSRASGAAIATYAGDESEREPLAEERAPFFESREYCAAFTQGMSGAESPPTRPHKVPQCQTLTFLLPFSALPRLLEGDGVRLLRR